MTQSFARHILHAGAIGIIEYGLRSMRKLPIFPEMQVQYGGQSQYLTLQGVYLTILTMSISLLVDLFPSINVLRYVKRTLLMIVLPLNIVISLIYWPLILFFPTLIAQQVKEAAEQSPPSVAALADLFLLPKDVDLSLHAAPAITLALDFFLCERKYGWKATKFFAPLLACVYAVGYGCWVERCATRNDGTFPYPFLTDNPFNARLTIYAGASMVATLSFSLLNSLHA